MGEEDDLYENALRDDHLVSESKESFFDNLRNAPLSRLKYLDYWGQFAKKTVIDFYDELIEKQVEIRHMINLKPHLTKFLARRV